MNQRDGHFIHAKCKLMSKSSNVNVQISDDSFCIKTLDYPETFARKRRKLGENASQTDVYSICFLDRRYSELDSAEHP